MIWHIFRKDARLLWPMAALVTALHACAAITRHMIDRGMASTQLEILSEVLSALALLGISVLVVVAMHQDPVPGTRQDWLIRPIRRRELVLAKLLFVLLAVQLPLWIVDLGATLAAGFALPAAGDAAALRNFQIFCAFSLPCMVIGSITRTFVEAFIAWAIGFLGYIAFFQVFLAMLLGVRATIMETGAAWMFAATFDAATVIGAAVILALQYFERRTTLARWLVGLGGGMVVAVAFMPWRLAFGMQQALSAEPAAAQAVAVVFDPQAGRYRLPLGAAPAVTSALHLPLRISNLPTDSNVLMDRADVRITGVDQTLLYQGKTSISVDGRGSWIDAHFEVHAAQGDGPVHSLYQSIYLPAEVFARLKDRPVHLAIDYSLTLFRPSGNYALPATGGYQALPGLGRCATRIDADGDDVAIGCWSATRQRSCITAYLEYPATGARNPESHICVPNYSPLLIGQFWPDAIYRMGGEVRFFDRSGLARYPVDGPKLGAAKLIVTTYAARDHFTRHVDTPVLRLGDLTGLAAEIR